jgi:hypothetical protein
VMRLVCLPCIDAQRKVGIELHCGLTSSLTNCWLDTTDTQRREADSVG